ncbi:ATP-binding protein [Saccharothrix mutabilis subsp. mutabilis]|uniref:histidine kinase n=1 Tax=Saccharothrix mutabilis subsp. mutabilis TaxID=66855 RepID=A0ABN0UFC5_9PSEU
MLLGSGALLLGVNYLLVRGALPVPTEPPSASPPPQTGAVQVSPDTAVTGSQVQEVNVGQYRADVLNTLLVQSGVALAASAVIALLLGRLAAAGMLRPVHEVVATARRLGADDLHRRIGLRGPKDELTELADTFDQMLGRLERSFDSQRRFVANASHELRTPLATQRTLVEVALSRPGENAPLRELCERLLVMNARSEALIEGLLVLAGSDRGLERPEDVRLDQVVARVLAAHARQLATAGIAVRSSLAPRVVRSEPVLLEQLVTNLVDNAIKYNDGGEIVVRVDASPALEIANTGPEVPPDRVQSLFEPFVQLRRERLATSQGVGLGLSIVASIARAHGGAARATPRSGGGLVVAVTLP